MRLRPKLAAGRHRDITPVRGPIAPLRSPPVSRTIFAALMAGSLTLSSLRRMCVDPNPEITAG